MSDDRNASGGLAVTLTLLILLNVAAIAAAPVVERFAFHHGEPGWQGRLYPVMTVGLVLAVSLLIVHDMLSGRRPAWWSWLVLAVALAFTGLAVAVQGVVI